jgi:cyclase
MLRLIARLDIKNGVVIKGIHLDGQRRIGDPIELAKAYYRQGIDEILFMDSVASLYDRSNLFDTVVEACRAVFVPITMGGGVRSISDVEQALACGADKVAVNTALVRNPALVEQIARVYGSQCLVGSIEAKSTPGGWEAYISNGREPTGLDVIEWARELEQRGIGELLVTSVDREGTQRGFDLRLYEQLEQAISVPLIACGGAGNTKHLAELDQKVALQGMAVASVLHYAKASIKDMKAALPRTSKRREVEDDRNS